MPSISTLLGVGTVLSTLSTTAFAASYKLEETFTADNWLDAFEFQTYDYNFGFVEYVQSSTAMQRGMYRKDQDGDIRFGVDSTETLKVTDKGRKSVRLEGRKNYEQGLYIIDIKNMPGKCGMWPAFWALGEDRAGEPWPKNGEIDIIEGVNDQAANKYVLHTDTQCSVNGAGQTGRQGLTDCALDGPNRASGCDVSDARSNSYGKAFNSNRGGIYAMEWTSTAIRTWFFPRGSSMPQSLTSGSPDTADFGTPAASFQGACNIEQRFKKQRFIFTNNFCGEWAGNVYANSNCPKYYDATGKALDSMSMCKKFVAENPNEFADQYWKISSFKTYSKRAVVSSSSSAVRSSTRASSSMAATSTRVSSTASSRASSTLSTRASSSSSRRPSSTSTRRPSSTSTRRASSTSTRRVSSTSTRRATSTSTRRATSTSTRRASSTARPVSTTKVSSASSKVSSASSKVSSASSRARIAQPSSSATRKVSSTGSTKASSTASINASSSSKTSSVSASVTSCSTSATSTHKSNVVVSKARRGLGYEHRDASSDIHSDVYPSVTENSDVLPSPTSYDHGHDVEDGSSSSIYHDDAASSSVYDNDAGKSSLSKIVHPTDAPSSAAYPTGKYDSYDEEDGYPGKHVASSSAPAHGDGYDAKSTPVYGNGYDAKSSAVYVNGYDTKSSAVHGNEYPYLPSFTPLSPYPEAATTKPVYGAGNDDKDYPEGSKTTSTTTVTYIDVCETGYTTITTTHIVTYGPGPSTAVAATPTPGGGKPFYPPPGFEVTTKVCNKGCGNGPKTVTVTIPATQYIQHPAPTPVHPVPTAPVHPGDNTLYTTIYRTKVITLSKAPAATSEHLVVYPSSAVDGDDKPSKPAQTPKSHKPGNPIQSAVKPSAGNGYPASNGTVHYSTGVLNPTASKTGYDIPQFTGAASSARVGGFIAVLGFAAMLFVSV
ncbi:hypothetical protein NX059_011285 [Plenodomus lindquistii]|nr:hypothetical protein NX059_011285 [Plenodomus lindquistii]